MRKSRKVDGNERRLIKSGTSFKRKPFFVFCAYLSMVSLYFVKNGGEENGSVVQVIKSSTTWTAEKVKWLLIVRTERARTVDSRRHPFRRRVFETNLV